MPVMNERDNLDTDVEGSLNDCEQIKLSPQDWERFADLLNDDSPPNTKLQNAMHQYQRTRAEQHYYEN